MNATPNGLSRRPSIPVRKNNGRNAATIIRVELKIGILTSADARYTVSSMDNCCSGGRLRFWRKRLYTFSTSTMASSTKHPIAMAIPPRLIVLIVKPKAFRIKTVIMIDKGNAITDIMVVRKFIKKMKSTITTNNAPSKSDS